MKIPSIKISVGAWDYAGVRTLAGAVIQSMTGNSKFPDPSPSLLMLTTAKNELTAAITAWGTPGHRGSKIDFANLTIAATNMLNLLKKEAAYVTRLIDRSLTLMEQLAFILSSGFEAKGEGAPQGVLQAPQNLHRVLHQRYSPYTPKIKWSKPEGLLSRNNVKLWHVFRSSTWNFSDAVKIAETTRTSFIDTTAPKGVTQYYFVAAFNTAGLGVVSAGIEIGMPN